jgi:DNA-3-methyladenine glycosylase I
MADESTHDGPPTLPRCPWATTPALIDYHDHEWAVPLHDDDRLFEALVLNGVQAGLSWRLVLDRRAHYRRAFDRFDPEKVAKYDGTRIDALLNDARLIRNRRKMESAVHNARAVLAVRESHGSFAEYLWGWVDGRPIVHRYKRAADVPARTELSTRLSSDLRRQGFRFVGPVMCYALMQAVGMVNDHLVSCHRHAELAARG